MSDTKKCRESGYTTNKWTSSADIAKSRRELADAFAALVAEDSPDKIRKEFIKWWRCPLEGE